MNLHGCLCVQTESNVTVAGSEKWVACDLWFVMTIVFLHRLEILAKEIARACMYRRMIGNTAPDLDGMAMLKPGFTVTRFFPQCGNVELSTRRDDDAYRNK